VENKVCGATDIELTPLGHEQAMELGRKIKGMAIQEILASPLVRAKNTAEHISQLSGIPMRVEEALREQNFGIYEAGPRDSKEFLEAKSQFVNRFETGESMLMVAKRIYTLLDGLSRQDKTYLLVAHNGIARVVHSYFYDMTNEEYAKYSMKNCELVEYEWRQ
jgi:probable phosphoglycerate mutase